LCAVDVEFPVIMNDIRLGFNDTIIMRNKKQLST